MAIVWMRLFVNALLHFCVCLLHSMRLCGVHRWSYCVFCGCFKSHLSLSLQFSLCDVLSLNSFDIKMCVIFPLHHVLFDSSVVMCRHFFAYLFKCTLAVALIHNSHRHLAHMICWFFFCFCSCFFRLTPLHA